MFFIFVCTCYIVCILIFIKQFKVNDILSYKRKIPNQRLSKRFDYPKQTACHDKFW